MQATVKQYSQALYEATKEKSQSEVDIAIANFVNILAQDGQLKWRQLIVKSFEEIYNQENKIIEVEVTTCQKIDSHLRHHLEQYLGKKYMAKKIIINEKIDKDIQGGIILQVRDERLDGSIGCQLAELKKRLKK